MSLRVNNELLNDIYSNFEGAKSHNEIDNWLLNFQPEHQFYALKLLSKFTYYNSQDITQICKRLFFKLKYNEVNNPCFVGFGPASKSGPFISYYFRLANELSNEDFFEFSQIRDLRKTKYDAIVLLDDFVGSGNQAIEFWAMLINEFGEDIYSKDFYYLAIMGFDFGKNNIISNTNLKAELGVELTAMDQAFFTTNAFNDYYECQKAKVIMEEYGRKLFPSHPLGYKDSQALILTSP